VLVTGAIGASYLSIHVEVTPYVDSNGMKSRVEGLRHRRQENEGILAGYCQQRGSVRLEFCFRIHRFFTFALPQGGCDMALDTEMVPLA